MTLGQLLLVMNPDQAVHLMTNVGDICGEVAALCNAMRREIFLKPVYQMECMDGTAYIDLCEEDEDE